MNINAMSGGAPNGPIDLKPVDNMMPKPEHVAAPIAPKPGYTPVTPTPRPGEPPIVPTPRPVTPLPISDDKPQIPIGGIPKPGNGAPLIDPKVPNDPMQPLPTPAQPPVTGNDSGKIMPKPVTPGAEIPEHANPSNETGKVTNHGTTPSTPGNLDNGTSKVTSPETTPATPGNIGDVGFSVPTPNPLTSTYGSVIEINPARLEEFEKKLRAVSEIIQSDWKDILAQINTIPAFWTGADADAYLEKVRSYGPRINAACEAINALAHAFMMANHEMTGTKGAITSQIQSL